MSMCILPGQNRHPDSAVPQIIHLLCRPLIFV